MSKLVKTLSLAAAFQVLVLVAVPQPLLAQTDDTEGLTTSAGNPLKVVVRADAALYERPDKTSSSQPVQKFEFFYVLPSKPGGAEKLENGFYRVATAPRLSAHVGWLPQDAALEWSHVQVVGLRPPSGRQPVLFFAAKDDAVRWYKGDSSVQPIAREPAQVAGPRLMPLLDVSSFQDKDGAIEVYKLAYLQGSAASPAGKSPAISPTPVTSEELRRDFVLQVTFCIDTTQSMEPWIEAVKKVVAAVVEELDRDPVLRDRVQFGLVCYRDQLKDSAAQAQMEYVAKMVCDLKAGKDHKEFLRRLADVHEAKVDSEDFPEDVLAGLKMAIGKAGWQPAAQKHIVLIGDASGQTDLNGYKNVEKLTIPGVVALAQPTGAENVWDKIQIHALRILGSDPPDRPRCKEHFTQLTRGRDYPGLHLEYAGPDDAAKFVRELTERLRTLAGDMKKVVVGKADDVVRDFQQAAPGSDTRTLLGLMVDQIRAAGGDATAAPVFAEGYAVALDREGNKALEPHVLVSHGRLSLCRSAMDFCVNALEQAGEPGKKDVNKIVNSLQVMAAGVNLGENVTPDTPLEKFLSLALGFPVRNPVFAMTPAKLAAMSAKDYQLWVQQVRASEAVLQSHLDNVSVWFSLGAKPAPAPDRLAFLKVADLP